MSTFGYRRELSKYEDLDEDELLASLTAEELQELEKELADIDPDDNLPIGLRQRDQTAKTPTGTFSREALMKYWENETRKLLEEERTGSTSPRQVSDQLPQTLPTLSDKSANILLLGVRQLINRVVPYEETHLYPTLKSWN